MSIKESARIAQSNNFMGLICRSSLLVRLLIPPLLAIAVPNTGLSCGSLRLNTLLLTILLQL